MSSKNTLLTNLSDDEIVKGISSGDIARGKGIVELLGRHATLVQKYLISKYSLDETSSNSIMGEVASTVWEIFEDYNPEKSAFPAWLYGIARNKLFEFLRVNSKFNLSQNKALLTDDEFDEDLVSSEKQPEEQLNLKELQKTALAAVMTLSSSDRLLFLLKSNYDLTYSEIAEIFNKAMLGSEQVTADALAKRFSRARIKLKQAFLEAQELDE